MNSANWNLELNLDCETVIAYTRQRLAERGIHVVRSFDLQSACASYPDLTCPHHGTGPCDCQLVVLLAYGKEGPPASLVVHSHRGRTEIEMAAPNEHQSEPDLVALIQTALETSKRYVFSFSELADVTEE